MNANAALIFIERRITGGVLHLQYSTADYWHLWTFANVTSRLNELKLQSDPCVHDSESKNPVWVFPVCNDPIDGKMGVRMCTRGFGVTG